MHRKTQKTDMMGPKQEHRKTHKKRTLCAQNKPSEKRKNGHDGPKTRTQKNAKKRARCVQNRNTEKRKKTGTMCPKQEHRKT